MAILDMLGSDLADAGRPVFTAAAPLPNEVAVSGVVAPVAFLNSAGGMWFERGDNLILKAIWVRIPYGFAQGTGTNQFQLRWEDSAFNIIGVVELPSSWIQVPEMCGELNFPPDGLHIVFPQSAVGKARLTLDGVSLNISMVNLPATLSGVVVSPQWHLQVLHTKALTAVP